MTNTHTIHNSFLSVDTECIPREQPILVFRIKNKDQDGIVYMYLLIFTQHWNVCRPTCSPDAKPEEH
ncbi:hypothetical protein BgiBS90_024516 [Biomphalaria glabrata]|nr:hypothetical protein BgiBS90_024516 [Biomphalaria glabrata]